MNIPIGVHISAESKLITNFFSPPVFGEKILNEKKISQFIEYALCNIQRGNLNFLQIIYYGQILEGAQTT